MAAYGLGASLGRNNLVGQGIDQQKQATDMLAKAAEDEQRRNITNKQQEAARKQGNMTLGATAGAMAGMQAGAAAGPWGALIGAAAGALMGSAF